MVDQDEFLARPITREQMDEAIARICFQASHGTSAACVVVPWGADWNHSACAIYAQLKQQQDAHKGANGLEITLENIPGGGLFTLFIALVAVCADYALECKVHPDMRPPVLWVLVPHNLESSMGVISNIVSFTHDIRNIWQLTQLQLLYRTQALK